MVIMAPKDEIELQHMLYTSIEYDGPSAVRYPRGAGQDLEFDDNMELQLIPIGSGELLVEGDDILLLPVGNRVYPALDAAKMLKEIGINATVINPRFIKPLDAALIAKWAAHTGKLITIEDNARLGGFGSSILELLSSRGIFQVQSKLLGHPDNFVEHGPQKTLWKNSGIDTGAIVEAAKELLGVE
jgi:1-deoxy-D-xylulose-5-phosphate synthase